MASTFRFNPSSASLPRGTIGLLITFGICAIIGFLPGTARQWSALLALIAPGGTPWGFLTYPLVVPASPFYLLFQGLWLWSFGSMLERSRGTAFLLRFFFLATILTGFLVYIAGIFIDRSVLLYSPFAPIAFITVLACAMMPNQEVLFWFVPLKLKWLALITAAFLLFNIPGSPVVKIAGTLPLIFAWYAGAGAISLGRSRTDVFAAKKEKKRETREFDEFFGKVREREQERLERERLRKLFEDSLDGDDRDR